MVPVTQSSHHRLTCEEEVKLPRKKSKACCIMLCVYNRPKGALIPYRQGGPLSLACMGRHSWYLSVLSQACFTLQTYFRIRYFFWGQPWSSKITSTSWWALFGITRTWHWLQGWAIPVTIAHDAEQCQCSAPAGSLCWCFKGFGWRLAARYQCGPSQFAER